ncbi:MAG: hypothetical protein HDR88_13810 [Bacteroides sp.]|nr:hypothetical protein [Bacteroides sp.]
MVSNKYPYYIYPDVIALKEGTCANEEEVTRARRRIAANVGDIRSLRLILGIDPAEFANFYPDMTKAQLSTSDTIDSFLTHFGKEGLPVSQAIMEIPEPEPPKEVPKTMADAQLLIKKHDYEGALEIIMQQSLNNPKKSIYFADQIRFLRKLILNKSKQNNK